MILSRDELIERCRADTGIDPTLAADLIDTLRHMWLRAEGAEAELDKGTPVDTGVRVRLFYQGYEQSGPDTFVNTMTSVDVPVREERLAQLLTTYAKPNTAPMLAGAEVIVPQDDKPSPNERNIP